jgi:hypothetical protein
MKSITIPLSLLEDIFRLLDYLDDICGRDSQRYYKTHQSGHDTAFWELKFKINRLQGWVTENYLMFFAAVTEAERHDLNEWVAGGNSVYDNPYSLYTDNSNYPSI